MHIPDPIEQMENMAERWADDNIKGNEFKCGCGKWTPLSEAQPSSANPYAQPICGECFDKMNEINP